MAVQKTPRNEMPEQNPGVRAHNFHEVALGYNEELAVAEAKRCLQCKNALCRNGCPVAVRIPEMMAAVAERDFEKAAQIVKSTNSLPSVCGRVCPQEEQCEKYCLRARIDEPVSIGAVERFVGDKALEAQAKAEKVEPNGKKVAVVGSGPASLTCAAELAKAGVEVTIMEAFHKAGGVLTYGIPEFRLPKALVQNEIDSVLALGVKMETNVVVGKSVDVCELLQEYDAVFIGSGAGLPSFMGIEGESLNGVFSANEYLTRVNLMGAYREDCTTPVQKGQSVSVIGAGNVAMDAARTALRMGAEHVRIIYRRGKEEMPARKEEIKHAEQEGIEFMLLTNPTKMLGENGWVKSLECVKMELGEPDASGRRRPVAVKGSEFEVATDMVIVALGTTPNPLIKDSCSMLETNPKGTLKVDERMQTSIAHVYAGGDAVTGAATVILAMGAGRKASASILEDFGLTQN